MNKIFKYALLNTLGTVVYIGIVASFLFNAGKIFGENEPDTILAPILMLTLFVFSAAVTSSLVLGRPIIWYLNGNKKEAITLLLQTLALMLLTLVIFFILVYFISLK